MSDWSDNHDLSPEARVIGLSRLWKEVDYNFVLFDRVPELDWDLLYEQSVPKVLSTHSTYDYYRLLQKICALLRDGHTSVQLPERLGAQLDRPRIAVERVQERAIVVNVGVDLQDIVPLGAEVVSIDGTSTQGYLLKEVLPYISSSTEQGLWKWGVRLMLTGIASSSVKVGFLGPTGEMAELVLCRNSKANPLAWVAGRGQPQPLECRTLDDGIVHVAINTFADQKVVSAFEKCLPMLCTCNGLILDLRRNPGGNSDVAFAIARYLATKPLRTSKWRTREHVAAFKAYGQFSREHPEVSADLCKYEKYVLRDAWYEEDSETIMPHLGGCVKAPMVVLISNDTASAAEDFLIAMGSIKRAVMVGKSTDGSTGQPLIVALPGGGFARICAKRDTYPDGSDFVGVGILPDIEMEPTIADACGHSDSVLQRGIQALRERIPSLPTYVRHLGGRNLL